MNGTELSEFGGESSQALSGEADRADARERLAVWGIIGLSMRVEIGMSRLPLSLCVAFCGLIFPRTDLLAAPPPPPPPGAIERATAIISAPKEIELATYARLFSEDVAIIQNNKIIGSGRSAWTANLRSALGLNRKVLHVSYGNPIMVAETLNNISYRGPAIVQDCCFWARVTFYHLRSDGIVDEVRIVENGSFWGRPEQPE